MYSRHRRLYRELHGFRPRTLAIGRHIDCMDNACTVQVYSQAAGFRQRTLQVGIYTYRETGQAKLKLIGIGIADWQIQEQDIQLGSQIQATQKTKRYRHIIHSLSIETSYAGLQSIGIQYRDRRLGQHIDDAGDCRKLTQFTKHIKHGQVHRHATIEIEIHQVGITETLSKVYMQLARYQLQVGRAVGDYRLILRFTKHS